MNCAADAMSQRSGAFRAIMRVRRRQIPLRSRFDNQKSMLLRLNWQLPPKLATIRGPAAIGILASMLTKKGKYGIKALLHLAQLPPGQLAFVADVASINNIPKKFLDAILGELRNAGFVQSRKGKGGGYRLARAAEEIMVGHVVRVLDGPLAPISCASRTRYEACEDCGEETCQVRHMMLEVRQAIADVLDGRSLASLRDSTAAGLVRAS